MNNQEIMREFDSNIAEIKRKMIRELLDQCTEGEVDLFNRMYGSIDVIPEEKMSWAYTQCKRTVDKKKEN